MEEAPGTRVRPSGRSGGCECGVSLAPPSSAQPAKGLRFPHFTDGNAEPQGGEALAQGHGSVSGRAHPAWPWSSGRPCWAVGRPSPGLSPRHVRDAGSQRGRVACPSPPSVVPRVGAGPSFPDAPSLVCFPVSLLDPVCGPWVEYMGWSRAKFSRGARRRRSHHYYESESLSFLSLEPSRPCAPISAV